MALERRQVEIVNELGLHLRAARIFSRLAQQYQAEVRVHLNGRTANGKSILDLTMLIAECGTRLDLEADDPAPERALHRNVTMIPARGGRVILRSRHS